ncbi:MAG: hypothetical protein QOH61_968 [Chloroflexota bacterium]|jgi:cytidylate kinase|nr:hypothetical protein [Chloroflexota bacterium]
MPIITISRTFGAGGTPIGRDLARRFDAEFLDRSIVAAVAARSGISEAEASGYDEQLPSVWQRVAAMLATGGTELAMPPVPSEHLVAGVAVEEQLNRLTRAVIEEAADRGNAVIVGRGGAFILRRHPTAVHVQVHAPIGIRVRHLMSSAEEIPADARPDEASLKALCRSIDARRAEYVKRLFQADWLDPSHYHLAIDTGAFDFRQAADVIELAARRRSPEAAAGGEEVRPGS